MLRCFCFALFILASIVLPIVATHHLGESQRIVEDLDFAQATHPPPPSSLCPLVWVMGCPFPSIFRNPYRCIEHRRASQSIAMNLKVPRRNRQSGGGKLNSVGVNVTGFFSAEVQSIGSISCGTGLDLLIARRPAADGCDPDSMETS